MAEIVAIRPFLPARDFGLSRRYYTALGGRTLHQDETICVFAWGQAGFLLQNYFQADWAANCMMQLVVADLDGWWRQTQPEHHAATFGAAEPRPPAIQPWGMKVGYLFDPSGVLWHVVGE